LLRVRGGEEGAPCAQSRPEGLLGRWCLATSPAASEAYRGVPAFGGRPRTWRGWPRRLGRLVGAGGAQPHPLTCISRVTWSSCSSRRRSLMSATSMSHLRGRACAGGRVRRCHVAAAALARFTDLVLVQHTRAARGGLGWSSPQVHRLHPQGAQGAGPRGCAEEARPPPQATHLLCSHSSRWMLALEPLMAFSTPTFCLVCRQQVVWWAGQAG